jgi:hypothetical protein
MRSPWGNVKVINDKGGRCVRGWTRKKYTRTHPYPEHINRVKPLPREKAAIVMLRKKGYPINMLATFLGRSTSFIHRILRFNVDVGNLRYMNMRKFQAKTRMRECGFLWKTLESLRVAWERFILGEGDKPP